MVQLVKDLELPLLWQGLDAWPRSFHMGAARKKKLHLYLDRSKDKNYIQLLFKNHASKKTVEYNI